MQLVELVHRQQVHWRELRPALDLLHHAEKRLDEVLAEQELLVDKRLVVQPGRDLAHEVFAWPLQELQLGHLRLRLGEDALGSVGSLRGRQHSRGRVLHVMMAGAERHRRRAAPALVRAIHPLIGEGGRV